MIPVGQGCLLGILFLKLKSLTQKGDQKAIKQSDNNGNANGRVFYLNANNSVGYSNTNNGYQL